MLLPDDPVPKKKPRRVVVTAASQPTTAPTVRMPPVVVSKPADADDEPDPNDQAIGALMADTRSGDAAGARSRFMESMTQALLNGPRKKQPPPRIR